MGLPKGVQKIVGVGCTITDPTGPTTTITVSGGSGPPPATTVTGPDAFGDSAVVGTGTHYARNDHDHGLPAAPTMAWGEAATATFSGSGSPVGVVTPNGEGDLYVDTTTPALYQATGATSADWQLVGGGLPAWFQYGSGSPVGVVTPNRVGALYEDVAADDNTGLWTAFGADDASWFSLGAPTGTIDGSLRTGLTLGPAGAGATNLVLSSVGAGTFSELRGDDGSLCFVGNGVASLFGTEWLRLQTNLGGFSLFVNAGDPNGTITANAVGDACVDTSTPALWLATAADDSHWVRIGGGVASLSGTGLSVATGDLTQAGGLEVNDDNGTGIALLAQRGLFAGNFGILSLGGGAVNFGAGGYGHISLSQGYFPVALPTAVITLPLVVATGVNDTFVYTPIATGIPDIFTMAAGNYATAAEVAAAMDAAVNSTLAAFSTIGTPQQAGFFNIVVEALEVGDTLTTGATDVLADLGFASPTTVAEVSDTLGFFDATGAQLQTVTGFLSAVLDANAKAVLTSLIAALSAATGYGLVLDGTT